VTLNVGPLPRKKPALASGPAQTAPSPLKRELGPAAKYDAQGRLIEQATPQGTLNWSYDAAGRITERTTAEGTTRYEYDAGTQGDGRLTKVTAPDGKSTAYSYDAAGQVAQSVQQLATGVELVTYKRYDSQGRQIAIAHSRRSTAGTSLIAGQAIERAAGGAVQGISTYAETASFNATTGAFTGSPTRIQRFTYDANARLTQERQYKGAELTAYLANQSAPATTATTYEYDAVGNRKTKTTTTAAGTESTTYTYDNNDRLTAETLTTATGSASTTSYTWDGNGNIASKTTPSQYTGYTFDADNRLIEVRQGASQATATSLARYGYDAEGQRIRKQTPQGTTHYLIDPTTAWPQVALEATGTTRTAYVWGHELRQQATGATGSMAASPSEDLIPLAGHLGTTMAAISKEGLTLERYEGSAWGGDGERGA
jgi:YD repeat-containing protein